MIKLIKFCKPSGKILLIFADRNLKITASAFVGAIKSKSIFSDIFFSCLTSFPLNIAMVISISVSVSSIEGGREQSPDVSSFFYTRNEAEGVALRSVSTQLIFSIYCSVKSSRAFLAIAAFHFHRIFLS